MRSHRPTRREKTSRRAKQISLLSLTLCLALVAARARAADDVVLADFEADDYGTWKAAGDAFGAAPARGTLKSQQRVSGFLGRGLVNSYLNLDAGKGTLTSPAFKVERRYLNFLIGGGNRPDEACVNLLVDGKIVRTETGSDDEKLDWATWDLSELAGKSAVLQIVDQATGGWGHVNVDQIVLSAEKRAEPKAVQKLVTDVLYDETYRPQFHFTARKGWLNDPNGLVYYNGEYHLFLQHNPSDNVWGNMTWAHAVSKDLLRWQQLANAIEPDASGTIFSGSAVVDWDNTTGFGKEALVCVYTSAGKPFTQSLAYSTDNGRTFTKFAGNPVLKNISDGNRDPKVFWHAPTKKWVMALYVDVKDDKGATVQTISFYASPDLKSWTYTGRVDGFFECPDLFELPIDGDPTKTKWVLFAADGNYILGTFDGEKFAREPGKFRGDFGPHFYAAQTYADIPKADGRRILIGWMRGGKYPQMPFNQQMSFPLELTLRTTPQGVRLFRWPIREIAALVESERDVPAGEFKPGDDPLKDLSGDLFDIEASIEVGAATTVAFDVRGTKVRWTKDGKISVGPASAEMKPENGRIAIRLLVDRSSIELFGNGGAVAISSCFTPRPDRQNLNLTVEGAPAKIISMKVRQLKSTWK